MRRSTASTERTSVRSPRVSAFSRTWDLYIRPALIIGMVGAGVVLYLVACARLSTLECDRRRLERRVEEVRARELELHKQLAELRQTDRIRRHIAERGLTRPRGTIRVELRDMPPSLYAELPSADKRRRDLRARLGEEQEDAPTMYASAAPVD